MDRGTFMDIVSAHYKELKRLFMSRASKNGKKFNEDAFNDAFIKCAEHFGNVEIDYEEVVKYFWTTFNNRCKVELYKQSKLDEYDQEHDMRTTDDMTYGELMYEVVLKTVEEEFGENDMHVYSLYKLHEWTQKEIEDEGYDCKDFNSTIKRIHHFIKEYGKRCILNK